MRAVLYSFAAMAVIGLAYWAYSENYKTQDALRHAAELQREIGQLRETLSVLEAEWAYLTRPERLRDLAELNFERLQLLPITPEHFGSVNQVAYPAPAPTLDLGSIGSSIEVRGEEGAAQ